VASRLLRPAPAKITVIPQLVRSATDSAALFTLQRTLALGQASDRALVEIQECLARESEDSLVLLAMMRDRAMAAARKDDPGYDLGYRLWVEEVRGRPPEG
jgi:hypothetical protein